MSDPGTNGSVIKAFKTKRLAQKYIDNDKRLSIKQRFGDVSIHGVTVVDK